MSGTETIVRMRISLLEIAPEIWRRVEVPANAHLKGVHDVIQAVFGWQDYHLYKFRVGEKIYGVPAPGEDYGRRVLHARSMRLATLIARGVRRFDYIYDFGDDWRHSVVVEAVGPADPSLHYPRFVEGARRGPPEDVGGPFGYERFLKIIADKAHPEHREELTWCGGSYDPEPIDLAMLRYRLARIVQRRETGKAAYENSKIPRQQSVIAVSGTEGYAEQAETLVRQYESLSFDECHRPVLHLLPSNACDVLDIGAGTGRDAAGFAALGHRVVAVEPTAEMRTRAMALHPSPLIEWLDDSLPDLARLMPRREQFDVVMLTAVWMHLDAAQRQRAMPNVAALVKPGGVMSLSLRYGPVPEGRRMFSVSADETVRLAAASGLRVTLRREGLAASLGQPGVTWTRLAFCRV
jgi:SAM-dependent methyltransferase